MQFRNKMADEVDLRRRLASLEESVEMHEHMKRQVQTNTHYVFNWLIVHCSFIHPVSLW